MSHGPVLNTYHIMCSVQNQPALLRVRARHGKEALTIASRTATNLLILFATRDKATQ